MVNPALWRLSWRHAQKHRLQSLLALLGILLGVMVVTAVDIANHSALQSFDYAQQSLNGKATHRLLSDGEALNNHDFVRLRQQFPDWAMTPRIIGTMRIQGESFQLLGVEAFSELPFIRPGQNRFDSAANDFIARANTLIIDTHDAKRLGLKANSVISLHAKSQTHLAHLLPFYANPQLPLSGMAITDIANAQTWLDLENALSHIDLILDAQQQAQLSAQLPAHWRLESSQANSHSQKAMSKAFRINLQAMGLLAMLVGAFLIYHAMTFAVLQRRHEIAVLRSLGVTRQEILRLILSEAAILGLLGVILGLLAGFWLGQALLTLVGQTINDLYHSLHITQSYLSPWTLLKASALGIGVTLVSSVIPALEAGRAAYKETHSRSVLEQHTQALFPKLAAIGIGSMLLGLALIDWFNQGLVIAFAGLLLVIVGYSLLTPLLTDWLCRIPEHFGKLSLNWQLALRGLRHHPSRFSPAIAALSVSVAATVGVAIMIGSFRVSVADWLDTTLQSDIYISLDEQAYAEQQTIPQTLQTQIQQQTFVKAMSTGYRQDVSSERGHLRLFVIGPTAYNEAGFDFIQQQENAWQRWLDQQGVLISEPLANLKQIQLGDELSLHTPQGQQRFPVLGIVRDYDGAGMIMMTRDLFNQHWNEQTVQSLGIFLADNTEREAAVNQLHTLLKTSNVELQLFQNSDIKQISLAIFDRTFAITDILRLLTLMVAFVGILSALMAIQIDNAREFAILRATGLTPWQTAQLTFQQSAALGLIAALLAIPLGLLMSELLIQVINQRAFGWALESLFLPFPLLTGTLLALLAALLAAIIPALNSAKTPPAQGLRNE